MMFFDFVILILDCNLWYMIVFENINKVFCDCYVFVYVFWCEFVFSFFIEDGGLYGG